ncbi:MAG: prohibitin family protein [Oscillospiraceae bacterium]|nr:prohibitin family protein [Oscillospiraceae bacterium]MBO4418966.1 prohibitin family protein [Oscillospiraceae bacterium]
MTKLIFAVVILLVGIIASANFKSKEKKALGSLLLVVSILVSAGSLALACFQTVPTGHTGVVTTFGKVEDTTLDSGVHFVLPWQQVVKMDNRVQKETVELPCFSSDIQEVNLTYTINYQIKKSDAQNIYRTIGVDYYATVIQPCITESVKVVTARYTAEQLVGKRNELAAAIEVDLADKLLAYNIELVSTSIENMDFTNAFTDAVEAKQVAQQNKLRAETEAEQKVIEAKAEAEVRKVNADAAAYELLAKAEAEAEANRKISESLTQELINYTYAQSWNGKLPTVMTGSGDNSMIPVLDVNQLLPSTEPTEPVETQPEN